MRVTDVHQRLKDLCRMGIVKKDYIDIRILLAVMPITEEEARGCLAQLEQEHYISLNGDAISLLDR
jgi:hypothetical protein